MRISSNLASTDVAAVAGMSDRYLSEEDMTERMSRTKNNVAVASRSSEKGAVSKHRGLKIRHIGGIQPAPFRHQSA